MEEGTEFPDECGTGGDAVISASDVLRSWQAESPGAAVAVSLAWLVFAKAFGYFMLRRRIANLIRD